MTFEEAREAVISSRKKTVSDRAILMYCHLEAWDDYKHGKEEIGPVGNYAWHISTSAMAAHAVYARLNSLKTIEQAMHVVRGFKPIGHPSYDSDMDKSRPGYGLWPNCVHEEFYARECMNAVSEIKAMLDKAHAEEAPKETPVEVPKSPAKRVRRASKNAT